MAEEHGGLCVSALLGNEGGFFNAKGVSIPVAVTVFPGEQYQAPRSWAEKAYQNLIYFNEVDKGGHFDAWEQPQLFSEEVRAAFSSLRGEADHVFRHRRQRLRNLGAVEASRAHETGGRR